MERLTGVLGLLVFLSLAYLFSTNRRAIKWRTVIIGLILQILFAIFVLRVPIGQRIMQIGGDGAKKLLSFSFAGSSFVFGDLGASGGKYGFFFAFQVLPVIIFIAAFFAILYHYGIMQFIIRNVAKVMMRFMGASGAESLNVAASIFMGQTEAPLTIRPFLPKLTQSELMVVMTSGMAHVSGAIMGAYILQGIEAKHILAAVIMTAPGTFVIAKMLVPETETPLTAGRLEATTEEELTGEEKHANVLGAAAKGTTDGLWLALNVGAMLISFLALIALINGVLGGSHNWLAAHGFKWFPDKLETIIGAIFAPFAWLIGIPWRDCLNVGNLLGTRMVLNELVAFTMLGQQKAGLDPRSFTIATFALCGFANLSSVGIQIGGLGALAPNRRNDLARLGFRAMLAGTMANLMSASIVGILLHA
ncbi:Na+ dependent nucleoside transporter [Candidatus Koribacter versatilis Ellin345]|uniref:Na+ dependent nucleoside transporter n=1 Tax=Koribacter versatilis (strain Ellin345) TaxID=204669 RepID=Q1IM43_KORVE|nr:nucleoside transporter C-terminal domain-containing protein [Candidatus Koribacter versatilis]ABF42057.1 Na+ dependent nucleoside transporter [Candidatus Koribacter versatilis Ellin345]